MPKRNWPLIIGVALAIIFLVLAIVGPALAPQDPLQTNLYLKIDGSIRLAPVAPGVVPGYWLGTDEAGRDVLSRIVWGIRPTLVVCVVVALARLAVGVLIGLAAGWFRGTTERVIDALGSIGVGLPALVLAIALITFLGVAGGLRTFVIALTLVGWIEVANLVKAHTRTVVQAPYIESARALGVGPWGVVRRHLLPQLRPLLPVLLAFELSAALLLLTELGFLGIFIGGGTTYQFDTGGMDAIPVLTADQPELAQQISRFWTKFYRVPWEFLAVGAVIFGQIVAFNLVGEGLRRRLDVTQPRRRRWLHVPDRLLDRVPQLGWRWIPVGAAVAALLVGGWWYGQSRSSVASQPQTAPGAQVEISAAPSAPTFSDDPLSAEQLGSVDLEALMAQPGLLPENMTISQVSKRMPDQFRDMPAPIQIRNFTVKEAGVRAGTIVVVLYSSTKERDQAMQTMQEATAALYIPFGDGSSGTDVFSGSSMVVRCGALVQVRLVGSDSTAVQSNAAALSQALDAQLTPRVCQPEGATVAQASSAALSYGTAPRSVDELQALDLEALLEQPGLLPVNTTIGQVSERVPDQFRDVPEPVVARNFNLKELGVSAGNIVVLLYGSLEERDQAAQTMATVIGNQKQPDAPPVAGDRSYTFGLLPPGTTFQGDPSLFGAQQQVVFARCGAVVQVRPGGGSRFTVSDQVDEGLAAIVRALDERLTPLVCQQEGAPAAQASQAAPRYGTTPRSVDELATLDLQVLVQQIALPDTISIGQISERVPDDLRNVPQPVQVRNANLKRAGVSGGNIVVLVYGSSDEGNSVFDTLTGGEATDGEVVEIDPSQLPPGTTIISVPPVPAIGEQTDGLFSEITFVRCGTVVQVRLVEGDEAPAIAQALDAQFAPLVCQNE